MSEPQYTVRNKAWELYAETHGLARFNAAIRMQMRDAFNEGWAARKAAQYQLITEPKRECTLNLMQATERQELAEEIERSTGLLKMVPGEGVMQLGIKKTAQVIASLKNKS